MEEVPVFYYILIFGVLMSLVSLIGALTISVTQKTLNKFLSLFIAMASGTLLGGAFFHMLPHALNKSSPQSYVTTSKWFSFYVCL